MTTFSPGPTPNTVKDADGKVMTVPDGWVLLPPGDAPDLHLVDVNLLSIQGFLGPAGSFAHSKGAVPCHQLPYKSRHQRS